LGTKTSNDVKAGGDTGPRRRAASWPIGGEGRFKIMSKGKSSREPKLPQRGPKRPGKNNG